MPQSVPQSGRAAPPAGVYPELARVVARVTGEDPSREVAMRCRLSHTTITKLRRGVPVNDRTLQAFAEDFGVPLSVLRAACGRGTAPVGPISVAMGPGRQARGAGGGEPGLLIEVDLSSVGAGGGCGTARVTTRRTGASFSVPLTAGVLGFLHTLQTVQERDAAAQRLLHGDLPADLPADLRGDPLDVLYARRVGAADVADALEEAEGDERDLSEAAAGRGRKGGSTPAPAAAPRRSASRSARAARAAGAPWSLSAGILHKSGALEQAQDTIAGVRTPAEAERAAREWAGREASRPSVARVTVALTGPKGERVTVTA